MNQQFVQIERRNKLDREEHSLLIAGLEKQIRQFLKTEQIPLGELSGRINKSILTPKNALVPDCQTCGVCCATVLCVQVKTSDLTTLESYWEITEVGRDGKEIVVDRMMRRATDTGTCVALDGELGTSVKCGIYEQRPQLCRTFDAGSDKCHALRRAYGLESALTPIEIGEALRKIFEGDAPEESSKMIYASRICETENEQERIREITVWMEDDASLIIHQFNPSKEIWLESDLVGITLAEAVSLIASQKVIE